MARQRGRPRKAERPVVPWDEVDRLLVFGETITDPENGHEDIRYPSCADLGRRYGVSKSRVWQYAKKHNCWKRREESRAREQIRYEQKMVEKRAEARALSTAEEIQIIDDYLRGFQQALAEGKVRYDNPADFNTMSRLKEFKQGHADSRQEIKGFVSLDEIQARHRQLRDQLAGLDPALSGMARDDGDRREVGGEDVSTAAKPTEDPGEVVH